MIHSPSPTLKITGFKTFRRKYGIQNVLLKKNRLRLCARKPQERKELPSILVPPPRYRT